MKTKLACLALAALPSACVPGGSSAFEEAPQAPYSELSTVSLTESPDNAILSNFYCRDFVSDLICDFAFDDPPPKKETLKFSFETVFKLGNPNKFSVPMVELLLALKVFEGKSQAELAALCISFCDPAAEDCAAKPPEEACKSPDKEIKSLADFVPTIDDLVRVAKQAATGELDDNLEFRMIPARAFQRCRPAGTACELCGDDAEAADDSESPDAGTGAAPTATETICCDDAEPLTLSAKCHLAENEAGQSCELCDGEVESHIRFDLGIDPITSILKQVAEESIDALSAGEFPSFDIPYSVEGTLFFDVPVLGRFAIGFGPFASTWSLD